MWSTPFSATERFSKYYFIMGEIGLVAMQTVTRECMSNSSYLQYSLIYCFYLYLCTCVYVMFFKRCFSNQAHVLVTYTSHNMWELFWIWLCNRHQRWCLPVSLSYPVATADNRLPMHNSNIWLSFQVPEIFLHSMCKHMTSPVCGCEHNSPHRYSISPEFSMTAMQLSSSDNKTTGSSYYLSIW